MTGSLQYVRFRSDIIIAIGDFDSLYKSELERGEEHLLALLGMDNGVNIRTETTDGNIHRYFSPWSNVIIAEAAAH